ncbi:MAG: hydroxyacylglutathione hydrolase [Moraxellaceae bacterium]|nr:hydroxyacylglutathione hydrolase [Moraxellaceae bacterium]MBP8852114.1 hydroxyacylglutathione hydrolase [Moraxellaceae bacterium]MBP9045788.1 hydroxyacylglutathione hydrolase [Moraxellaceae bacterium]MBP9730419.1 hydroxyacylglutathione hydrolase [Moraxellaceae bacterium]MCC6199882.1 hydroxyacylglutathione hydrolase [Moraxellaceae bacterium]
MSYKLIALPAFANNYIWAIEQDGHALVVDPGDPSVVLAWLQERQLVLDTILITHHHFDHTGGLEQLMQEPGVTSLGPDENINGLSQLLAGGEMLELGWFGTAHVMPVPGHTRAHLAYYLPDCNVLFAGDTLFSAGCGRLFEGTAAQMYESLKRLMALPGDTLLCCTHEYTLANLEFAAAVEPENKAIRQRRQEVEGLLAQGRPSLPVRLDQERHYNPFLRCHLPSVAQAVQLDGAPIIEVFAALRAWKDSF